MAAMNDDPDRLVVDQDGLLVLNPNEQDGQKIIRIDQRRILNTPWMVKRSRYYVTFWIPNDLPGQFGHNNQGVAPHPPL